MGDPITMGTAGLSLASMGFKAAGVGLGAKGTASADEFKAGQLEQAAKFGELKATETNAQMTRNLTMTLGNIDAVRGASNTDPTSPTGVAVRDRVEAIGEEQRDITVGNIERQAKMDEASAAYLRKAAGDALLGGDIGIVGTLLGGGAGALKAMRPGSGGE